MYFILFLGTLNSIRSVSKILLKSFCSFYPPLHAQVTHPEVWFKPHFPLWRNVFYFYFKMFMHTGSYKDVHCLYKSSSPRLLLKWDTWTDFSKGHDLLCLRRSCQHTQERSGALQACKQLIQTKQKWFLSKHTDLAQGVILLWYWPRLGLQFNM